MYLQAKNLNADYTEGGREGTEHGHGVTRQSSIVTAADKPTARRPPQPPFDSSAPLPPNAVTPIVTSFTSHIAFT